MTRRIVEPAIEPVDPDRPRTGAIAGNGLAAGNSGAPDRSGLPAAAIRALAEAEERRKAGTYDPQLPAETGGRAGPEPTRYGDWEKNGIASDF